MLTREDIMPYARTMARFLGLLHILIMLYCVFNLVEYFGMFASLLTDDFVFFASYLTLIFSLIGSLLFVGHAVGKVPFGLAMLGCFQAALCAVGLSLHQSSALVHIVLIFYGTSSFVLKYTIPLPGALPAAGPPRPFGIQCITPKER